MKCETCPIKGDCWAAPSNRRRFCQLIANGRDDYKRYVVEKSQGYHATYAKDSSRLSPPGNRVVISTFFNSFSGFGRFAWKLGAGLAEIGTHVAYEARQSDTRYAPVDPWLLDHQVIQPTDPWRLKIDYYNRGQHEPNPYVYFTMHETTRLHDQIRNTANESHAVIVPTEWNKHTFEESGVTRPIHVCPLGYDPGEGWKPNYRKPDGKFRVLMVGMLPHGGVRKMFPLGIKAFQAAFHAADNVELIIKIWPECRKLLHIPSDPRIKVVSDPWPIAKLVALNQSCDVLLNPTASEGWGLCTLESMACGVPPICTLASAHAEFVTHESAWTCRHRTEKATGYYAGQGDWFPPRFDDLVNALVQARVQPEMNRAKGESAARQAEKFTWRHSAIKLRTILENEGVLSRGLKKRVKLGETDCVPCQASRR